MVQYKLKSQAAARAATDRSSPARAFCYDILKRVSRSFTLVIMELDDELRDPICIFYLVLRGLDTVEDDTSVPAEQRVPLLLDFYRKLEQPGYTLRGFGDSPHYIELLERFNLVLEVYAGLKPKYRAVISDITRRMGEGMAEHIRDVECNTIQDYDLYCHYVAGLVGVGLSRMFSESGRESATVARREDLSNSMGLFLQKTNIIRDYLEDMNDARTFWPREIWSRFVPDGGHLSDFTHLENRDRATACLNAMVTDALKHVPDCIEYMSNIRNPHVFNFVALPQVMAIGTLAECFNNRAVFEGVVKLRRGLTAKLVLRTKAMPDLFQLFFDFANMMGNKVDPNDPSAAETRAALETVVDVVLPHVRTTPDLTVPNRLAIIVFIAVSIRLLQRRNALEAGTSWVLRRGGIPAPQDMLLIAGLFLSITYLITFFGLQFVKPAEQSPPHGPYGVRSPRKNGI